MSHLWASGTAASGRKRSPLPRKAGPGAFLQRLSAAAAPVPLDVPPQADVAADVSPSPDAPPAPDTAKAGVKRKESAGEREAPCAKRLFQGCLPAPDDLPQQQPPAPVPAAAPSLPGAMGPVPDDWEQLLGHEAMQHMTAVMGLVSSSEQRACFLQRQLEAAAHAQQEEAAAQALQREAAEQGKREAKQLASRLRHERDCARQGEHEAKQDIARLGQAAEKREEQAMQHIFRLRQQRDAAEMREREAKQRARSLPRQAEAAHRQSSAQSPDRRCRSRSCSRRQKNLEVGHGSRDAEPSASGDGGDREAPGSTVSGEAAIAGGTAGDWYGLSQQLLSTVSQQDHVMFGHQLHNMALQEQLRALGVQPVPAPLPTAASQPSAMADVAWAALPNF